MPIDFGISPEDKREIARLIDQGWGRKSLSKRYGAGRTTATEWIYVYKAFGLDGLLNMGWGRGHFFGPNFEECFVFSYSSSKESLVRASLKIGGSAIRLIDECPPIPAAFLPIIMQLGKPAYSP